ncbi:MAG: HD domain-containing protein [Dehalococcoidia bacterium]|nr:HD domain-containing protein [Dehalococcoidia bacterium]
MPRDATHARMPEATPALRFPPLQEAMAMRALEDVIRTHPDLDQPLRRDAVRPLLAAVDALVDRAYDSPNAPVDIAGAESQLGHEYVHPIKTMELCIIIAQAAGLPRSEVRPLAIAAALMDIGYAALRRFLIDEPRRLEEREWRHQVARHPEYGVRILRDAALPDTTLDGIAQHHERWDGAGAGARARIAVAPFARIIAIADAYVTLRSRAAHRAALSHEDAVAQLAAEASRAFDPDLVTAFVDMSGALVAAQATTQASAVEPGGDDLDRDDDGPDADQLLDEAAVLSAQAPPTEAPPAPATRLAVVGPPLPPPLRIAPRSSDALPKRRVASVAAQPPADTPRATRRPSASPQPSRRSEPAGRHRRAGGLWSAAFYLTTGPDRGGAHSNTLPAVDCAPRAIEQPLVYREGATREGDARLHEVR